MLDPLRVPALHPRNIGPRADRSDIAPVLRELEAILARVDAMGAALAANHISHGLELLRLYANADEPVFTE